ncbi:protein of unknown function-containing protein [Forsythia ovata]|uniref:Uncharacterized protein n=1 Tax=Forsythia ovata TaxID=205694 RepID=A0ABD1X3B3_9LAMI
MVQHNEANAVAMATTTQAAAKISRLTRPSILVQEQHPAIVIQTAFRGYLARKALQALTGVVKLQAIVRGHNVRMRAKLTLQCMQSLLQVQSHDVINARDCFAKEAYNTLKLI